MPLPQLGDGTKPVRVCNGCFDVAYLVTYAIDEDHGISTQVCSFFLFYYNINALKRILLDSWGKRFT